MDSQDFYSKYKGKNVLITGGLGFLGSNIANKLVSLGANVTILDSLNPLYGGNWFNVEGIKDKIKVIIGDIRDEELVYGLVIDKDIIFNLAAQVSYIDSSVIPFIDLDINCRGHFTILEACRKNNKDAKIIFSSSRMVLGKIKYSPMDENHPTNPLSIYGIHKLAAEKYHLMYFKDYGMKTCVLRITNPYGERQQIKHNKYCLPGWFMRLAMENKPITVFGDGLQLRDYIYSDDLIEAFIRVGVTDKTDGQLYNCGSGKSRLFKDMAELVVKAVGQGEVKYVPWPENYEKVETGDFETNISKLSSAIDWTPQISLEQGIEKMVAYYKKNKNNYV